jgi:hypothetical protein
MPAEVALKIPELPKVHFQAFEGLKCSFPSLATPQMVIYYGLQIAISLMTGVRLF